MQAKFILKSRIEYVRLRTNSNKSISQFNKDCRDLAHYLDSISPMRWRCGTYDHRYGFIKRLPIAVQLRIVDDKIKRLDCMKSLEFSDMSSLHRSLVLRFRFLIDNYRKYGVLHYSLDSYISFHNVTPVYSNEYVLFNAIKKVIKRSL